MTVVKRNPLLNVLGCEKAEACVAAIPQDVHPGNEAGIVETVLERSLYFFERQIARSRTRYQPHPWIYQRGDHTGLVGLGDVYPGQVTTRDGSDQCVIGAAMYADGKFVGLDPSVLPDRTD
jgi:hypothetical protein